MLYTYKIREDINITSDDEQVSDSDSDNDSPATFRPDKCDSNSDSDSDASITPTVHRPNKKSNITSNNPSEKKNIPQKRSTKFNIPTNTEVSNSSLFHRKVCTIKPTEKNRSGRCYNKRQSCYYCEELVSSISHHLECSHGNEPEVARILALKPLTEKCPLKMKSLIAERKRLFGILRNRGNHQYNIGLLEKGEGEVILIRHPTSDLNVDDFRPCPDCQGWLVKTRMWDHQHYHCIGREHVKGKNELLNESDVLAGKYSHASTQLKNIVFPSMKQTI